MPTKEIPRHDWTAFFDSFSRQHRGWLVTVEVLGSDIGAQIEARDVPLEAITADVKGAGKDVISVSVGSQAAGAVTHSIVSPTHVWLKQRQDGADEGLEIEAVDAPATLIRFRSIMRPEQVDDIAVEPPVEPRKAVASSR